MQIAETLRKPFAVAVYILAVSLGASLAFPQVRENKFPAENWKIARQAKNETGNPAEKSIAVAPNINIQFCVSGGNVKVTGWERDEARVFINEGSQIGFKVMQKDRQSGKPVWITVLGYDPAETKHGKFDECLSGGEIELEVPRGAVVNIKSREGKTKIDTVREASVKNVSGDIFLNNIGEGIQAYTYEGDVTAEKSAGAITLESVSGNVLAFDVEPSKIGDVFKAKTGSGIITLQDIRHRQMEVETISGSIKFTGELAESGQYGFGTSNGAMNLIFPTNSSCRIVASYGFGVFNSEISLNNLNKSPNTSVKNFTANLGAGGDCTLNLRTYNGVILLTDKNKSEKVEK